MHTYSPFFQTLHDEVYPLGSFLGRNTHYSILRATVFHDEHGRPLADGAQFADFAVIWDGSHDERVIQPIERLYRSGDLSSFIMFGARARVVSTVSLRPCSRWRHLRIGFWRPRPLNPVSQ